MIILDSSFLIAVKILNDMHHEKAKSMMKDIVEFKYGKPILTDYIFDETVTGILARSKSLKLAIEFGNELVNSLDMVDISDKIFDDAWMIFSKQKSINNFLSFTDSTVLATMQENGIRNIATFDQDFRKIKEINVIGL